MPRSFTVCAAALLLASFSGSGSLLTTAEAMPAPGPQQTQGQPRYYFPRHVKRQIVTNSTAPAAPTSSTPKRSSSSELRSRQDPEFFSRVGSFFRGDPDTSSSSVRAADPTSAVASTQGRFTPPPETNDPPAGTGNLRPPPPPVQSSSSSADEVLLPPPSRQTPTPSPEPPTQNETPSNSPSQVGSSSPSQVGSNSPSQAGSTAPLIVLLPTPSASEPASGASSSAPLIVLPTPSASEPASGVSSSAPLVVILPTASASEPANGVSSSAQAPLVDPTGVLPSLPILQPTQSASEPVDPVTSGSGQRLASTGPVPSIIVTPTPSLAISAAPSADPTSVLVPFIIATSSEGVLQPSSSVGLLNSLLSPIVDPLLPTPTPDIGTTGVLPTSVLQPTSAPEVTPTAEPLISLVSSGIVVGLTTALGTGDLLPTPTAPVVTSAPIPTSEGAPVSTGLVVLPPILSSVVSEVNGLVPSGTDVGPTAPVVTPSASLSGVLPPTLSTLVPDLPSILSSVVSEVGPTVLPSALPSAIPSSVFSGVETVLPTASVPIPISTAPVVLPSSQALISSGLIPSSEFVPSGAPTQSPSAPVTVTPPVETPSVTVGQQSTGFVGTSAPPVPTVSSGQPISVPASEGPSSGTLSAPTIVPTIVPTVSVQPPTNGTISEAPTPRTSDTPSIAIPTIPLVSTTTTAPVVSQAVTAVNSQTNLIVGTSIIREPSTMPSPSATVSSIPSSLPKMIVPPDGVPPVVPEDSFMGQVCFKWPLNYPFVSANDGGNQIFHYLPIAIADGLDIPLQSVKNYGLKPLDTLAFQGFITTMALFTIPKDVSGNLQAALRNPADTFWHNKNSTVNDLTGLINTACALSAGKDNSPSNQVVNPAAAPSGGTDGGALGGDIGASRKVNSTSAIVASSAIVGAIAYGAAMFFVARRYRNKRIAHQRSSSVPSTSRMTYGSIPGGAAAWMHGARNGRITPGSRGSHGSSSTQGRSIRTQQISAPVMAENSLGWN